VKPLFTFVLGSLLLLCLAGGQGRARAQNPPTGQAIDPSSLSWPRFYATNGYEFAVYQPQISAWPGNQLEGRFVVAVRPAGASNETYGVVFFQARTDIDKVNRLVIFEDFQINRLVFPTQPGMQEQYRDMLLSFQQQAVKVIPLDHLEAVFAASADITKAKVPAVKNDPPRIIYATQPSLLILVDGPPVLKELTGDYQRVINTRAILLLDKNPFYQSYYLYADSQWFSAPALAGPWTVTANLPLNIDSALAAALDTQQVDPMYPKNPNAPGVSQIYISTVPAELIETTGSPGLLSVAGTDLLYLDNSSSAIFYYLDDGNYYVLISGRWFKAGNLSGPWAFVPPGSLPGDFKKIPADSEKSNVLLSVPGTPQAQEAVIANSIPQTAAIMRDQAKLEVTYYGAPSFLPIAGTTLCYAANTTTPVIMVSPNDYYSCQGGVWFAGATATGPWVVATTVPSVIYTIPASCPIHYVTYAYVYGCTPAMVYVGYTPGYMGTVVAPGGVVVYGTGYYYPPVVIGATYVCYPPTYGYAASFALGAAVGFSFGYCAGSVSTCCCEPYWGCYHWATPCGYSYAHCNVNACNYYTHWGTAVHATGSYGYNSYTGNEWASHSASTFNPYTGASATGTRGAAGNVYTGNYAAGKQGAGYNPSTGMYGAAQKGVVGNAYNGTAATVNRGVVGNANTGNSVAWNNGNMYADKNGNIYSYNQSSGAQKYNSGTGSFQSVSKPSSYSSAQSSWGGGSSSWFDRESSAQSLGSSRFSSWSGGGGGGWGGFRGGGGFGGGGGWRR